jgi:3-methyladenine DNA glycosylase AlkD
MDPKRRQYDWRAMDELVTFVRASFRALSDSRKAREMAAYMKTEMPFYGVQKPDRVPICRELKRCFPIESHAQYTRAVLAMWSQPHREEKYTAIFLALAWPRFIVPASLPLYRRLIVEGAWWDLVDDVAIKLVGPLVLSHRARMSPLMDRWIEDRNMWIRRSAILCRLKHKEQTDERQLFEHCLRRAHEKEFFIRKAIGWALRGYAYTAPRSVRKFLQQHGNRLAPLSFREAGKHLDLRAMNPQVSGIRRSRIAKRRE